MIGLVDCNNFYASCERVFDPALNGRPVLVLSNNDGCVIARSNEAKELGIPMGAPAFEIEALVEKNGVKVFSSNYTLYGDMSSRVMAMLQTYSPEVEIYSIDEAFMRLDDFRTDTLDSYGRQIIAEVRKGTGIPVSLGIAPSKTLAKLANKIAKKRKENRGVFVIDTDDKRIAALKSIEIGDVWGIGRRYADFLIKNKVNTAYDFTQLNKEWVQSNMTVVGRRMYDELRGEARIDFEVEPPAKQMICTSRSFGNMLSEYTPIEEAVANYAARCGAKLRKQNCCAGVMMVFVHTNAFRKDLPQYSRNIVIQLPIPTNSNIELVKYAAIGIKALYKEGFHYKKAGVIVSEIVPASSIQGNIFYNLDSTRHDKIMGVLDTLNKSLGRDKVILGKQGFEKSWRLRQEKLSPCYSTRMTDIITVKV
jgi:DNA polymerase V